MTFDGIDALDLGDDELDAPEVRGVLGEIDEDLALAEDEDDGPEGTESDGEAVDPPPLEAKAYRLVDPKTLPPRRWLLGKRLIRRYVTFVVAQGGAGKTTLSLAMALSLATGRALLTEKVHQRTSVWVLNLEDPLQEMRRRIAAASIHHGVTDEQLGDRLYVNSGRDRPLVLACKSAIMEGRIDYPDTAALVREARRRGIGLIVVDPFIASHALEENSNVDMNAAARAWAEVANEADCAVLLVHHTRKGAANGPSGDIEGGRGAKALSDAARVGLTMAPMSEKESEALGVPPTDRWRYVRLDDGKANLAPRAVDAKWFQLHSVELGNGGVSRRYPEGDRVQAMSPVTLSAQCVEVDDRDKRKVLDVIEVGLPNGVRYGVNRQGSSRRAAGLLLEEHLKLPRAAADRLIKEWLAEGVLVQRSYRNPSRGRDEAGLFVVKAKRPKTAFEVTEEEEEEKRRDRGSAGTKRRGPRTTFWGDDDDDDDL